jgi:predicted phage terminase large subunit-like protein
MTLLEYWEKMRPPKYKTDPIDKVRCQLVQSTYEQGQNFIDEEHPRSGKSEGNCMYGPAYWLRTHPNFKFGLITHSQQLANKFVGGVASLLRREGFEFEYERADQFKLKGSDGIDPSFWGSGISGGHTGKGCHRLILSDLLRSGSDAMSQKVREGIITDVISTAMNRIEPYQGRQGAVMVEQARLHDLDPVGWLVSESGLNYVRAHFAAVNDDGQSAWIEDTYAGTKRMLPAYSALTSRFPREKLDEIKGFSTGYFWSSQYLMEPKLGDQTYFDMAACPSYRGTNAERLWIAVDAANTATKTGSYTAMVCVGLFGQNLKVLAVRRGRWRFDEMQRQMQDFYETCTRTTGLYPEAVIVERGGSGYALIDHFTGKLPVMPLVPSGSKEERAGSVCWVVNRGQLHLPESAPWLKEYVDEMSSFPLGANNDMVDATVHCLSYALRSEVKRPDHTETYVHDETDRGAQRLREEMEFYKEQGTDNDAAWDFINSDPSDLTF